MTDLIMEYHNEEPVVYTIDDFIDAKNCKHFIDIAKNKLQDALVSSNTKGYVSSGRTGKNCWIPHSYDATTKAIAKKIADQVGLPVKNAESFQIIYYDKDQEYRNHTDSWDHDLSNKSRRCLRYGGQRMITALCYLNTVEEVGHTRFTRLNINVAAEKGKMLVFHNVYKDTNKKHPMSEHAGTPVIKGEKWAFNLWFREDDFKKVVYDPPIEEEKNTDLTLPPPPGLKRTTAENSVVNTPENITFLTSGIDIYDDVLSLTDFKRFQKELNFDPKNPRKVSQWLRHTDHPEFAKKLATVAETNVENLENMCFIQYPAKYVHGRHHDAFDTTIPNSKAVTEKMGQRLKTLTGFLSDGVEYNFTRLGKQITPETGSMLVYDNVLSGSNIRDNKVEKIIENTTDDPVIIFHAFVRERPNNTTYKPPEVVTTTQSTAQTAQTPKPPPAKPTVDLNEDYEMTLKVAYAGFEKGNISKSGYKSLTFSNIRTGWEHVVSTVKSLHAIRNEGSIIPKERLETSYKFDEFTPVVIEDAVTPEALKCVADYYKYGIDNNYFPFGDRQSKRFKTRNDPVSRMLHYELLPLVERATGERLRPSYTYLSCYVKGADLPLHDDNRNCQRTVSFLLDKPEGKNWNIYVHKVKQPVKYKGRYHEPNPPYEECIACDVERPGGLMLFDGTDHLHFREPLEHNHYYLLLLHYVPYDAPYIP